MKMRPVGAEPFLADRRTGVMKLRLFFLSRSFANAPNNDVVGDSHR